MSIKTAHESGRDVGWDFGTYPGMNAVMIIGIAAVGVLYVELIPLISLFPVFFCFLFFCVFLLSG